MPRDRKSFLGYVETIQLILGVTDKIVYSLNEHFEYSHPYSYAFLC